MDAGGLTGVVTAVGGALAAVIGAVALLLKVSAPNSRAVRSLRSLWEWLEARDGTEAVPARLSAAIVAILERADEDD